MYLYFPTTQVVAIGIHISTRQVVLDNYKVLWMSVVTVKLVWWISMVWGCFFIDLHLSMRCL